MLPRDKILAKVEIPCCGVRLKECSLSTAKNDSAMCTFRTKHYEKLRVNIHLLVGTGLGSEQCFTINGLRGRTRASRIRHVDRIVGGVT